MSRIAGLVLVAVGFICSVVDAYLDGFEEGQKRVSAAAAGLPHIHSIHEEKLVAFCAGLLIFVIGYMLLWPKNSGRVNSNSM